MFSLNEKQQIIVVESKIYQANISYLIKLGKIQQSLSRSLFNYLRNNKINNKTKKFCRELFCRKYKIHTRLFNSIWIDMVGKISAIKTKNKNQIEYLTSKIKEIETKIKQIKDKNKLYWLKNKFQQYKHRLIKAETQDINAVWGSKIYFNKQWNYKDKKVWKKEWQRRRDHMIYLVGSKSETFGNSLCQLHTLNKLVLTLPKCVTEENANFRYLELQVNFNYKKKNYEYLKQAINNNQALTYRIFQREKGSWYRNKINKL